MVSYCCMVNCRSRAGKKKLGKDKISFFRVPAIIGLNSRKYKTSYKTQTYRAPNSIDENADKIIALSKERQRSWIKAIRRGNLSESQLKTFRVCMKHFISGKFQDCIKEIKSETNLPTIFLIKLQKTTLEMRAHIIWSSEGEPERTET